MTSKEQSFGTANEQSQNATATTSTKKAANIRNAAIITFGGVSLGVLYFLSRQNYLLFHSITEIFSIVIAFAIFAIAS